MRIRVGRSSSPDPATAARQAVGEALGDGDSPNLALVFCTDQYDPEALAEAVTHALGTIPWAGCCTAGVFSGTDVVREGLVVGALSATEARVGIGVGNAVSGDARAAGSAAVAEALAALPPAAPLGQRAIILLPDALTGNVAEVVRGAVREAGTGVAWAGGGAGDNLRFLRTAQFAHGRAHRDAVAAIALDAHAPLATGVRHGFRAYGPARMVTRARGPVAIELEYESAFEVYRRTAADRGDEIGIADFARFAMSHPLGIPQSGGEFLIRDPLEVGPEGSLRCVAEVPDGSLVRVMVGHREALLEAAGEAAREARHAVAGPVGGALVFDCVSRFLMLGPEGIRDELACIREGLGGDAPLMGCLTFGEVGSIGAGVPQFHNKTAVVLAMGA